MNTKVIPFLLGYALAFSAGGFMVHFCYILAIFGAYFLGWRLHP